MHDHKLEQKYRRMMRRNKFLRVLVYISLALVLGSILLWKRFSHGSYGIFLGIVLFSLLVCILHWQNLRCPRCGKLLTEYRASVWRVPTFCISCGLELKSLKRDEYDLQPTRSKEFKQPEPTDALTEKCREIARRDRILRPMRWITFAVTLFLILLRDHAILSKPVANVLACIGCVFMTVAWILWEHNLRCPACRHHLTGKYTRNRIRGLSLPDEHTCGHCGAHLIFTGRDCHEQV